MRYALIYPMAAMVLLTAVVLFRTFRARLAAVKSGQVEATYYKTYQGENTEPRQAAQLSRHFINLFEAPTLFYAACLAGLATGLGGRAILWLAWLFVAARVVHAVIHLGRNSIWPRIRAYFAGWLALLGMWVVLVYSAATAT